MKKIIAVFSLLSFTMMSMAQKPATIEGSFVKDKFADVKLFKVENGEPKEIATIKPNRDGKFGFNFYPEYEGFYLIGMGTHQSPQNNYKFWIKSGDKLSFQFTDSTYELTGKNTKENKALEQWYKLVWPLEWKSVYFNRTRSTYVDFFPDLDRTLFASSNWISRLKPTGNKKFDAALKKTVKMDLAFFALTLLSTPRSAHPDPAEIPDYYSGITVKNYFTETQDVYFYPWGQRLLQSMLMREIMAKEGSKGFAMDALTKTLKYIPNDTLKGDYALNRIAGIKDYGEYLAIKDEIEDFILTDAQKDQEFKTNTALATLKPGDKGYEFKYEDKDGKMVSFSDLKGKVVLIDTWATWCAPCKVEIPHLKKLEEEMKGKNLHIVSLSVDEEKDKETWKQMIKDENLGGIQLFAKGWSDFAKYYKINAIPRFLVFDKEGKIISVDAPRPSNPELKKLIEKHL